MHLEEIHDLYSPNTIRVIKWRRMRWVGHIMGLEERSIDGFDGENLRETDRLEGIYA